MQVKLFTMPVIGGEKVEEELNKFLRGHRVLQVERHFCPEHGYWAMLVEYADNDPIAEAPPATRREKKDPTVGMTDEQKARFNDLRDKRNAISKARAVAPYLVFTNEELALMMELEHIDEESLRSVKGISKQRLKDYGAFFYEAPETTNEEVKDETSEQSDGQGMQSGEPA
ncbi:MAG: HRDC domain-containing protein [Bacteroidaceae bacterium]|nr:HRDC domain-containing protein [Bacteroidaceae bacterium]